ncbi:CBS domain-containing membrane protein [Paraburkholderia sp. 40]
MGIAFTGGSMHVLLGADATIPLLVAPMGGSAVLLFGVPASPLAQPWSIIGDILVSAAVGVACARWIVHPVEAGALAVALAICAMFALRCMHPPSGAVALTAVLGGPAIHAMGYGFILVPIAVPTFSLLIAAIVFHALTGHRYPHVGAQNPTQGANASMGMPSGFTRGDLEAVLRRRSEWLDIDTDDLESLLRDAQLQGYARVFSELTCANIMSRPPISVPASMKTEASRRLLLRHRVKALPVTDPANRVIGSVALSDLGDFGGVAKQAYRVHKRWLIQSIRIFNFR